LTIPGSHCQAYATSMGTRQIHTRAVQMTFDEDRGYVHVVHVPGSNVSKADAVELVEAMEKITDGRKCPQLVDVSKCKSVSFEARAYFSSPSIRAKYTALALVGGSPVGNMLANFGLVAFSKTDGPPIKMFTSERDALEWLTRFIVR
jgi:hypothetical protein